MGPKNKPNFHDSHRFGLTQNSQIWPSLRCLASMDTWLLQTNTTCRAGDVSTSSSSVTTCREDTWLPARFSSEVELLLAPPVSLDVQASFAFSRSPVGFLYERGAR